MSHYEIQEAVGMGEPNADPNLDPVDVSDDALDIFLGRIGKIPLLTAQEVAHLSPLVQAGDDQARTKMIESNLRLVVSVAKGYYHPEFSLLELIQEGSKGLIRAVEKFDPEAGNMFSTYATWWINQAVRLAISEKGKAIKRPRHIGEKVTRIASNKEFLAGHLGRPPTSEELAAFSYMTPDEVTEVEHLPDVKLSLQAPVGKNENTELGDIIADPDSADMLIENVSRNTRNEDMYRAMRDQLTTRERQILALRFGLGGREHSIKETAHALSLAPSTISNAQARALEKLANDPDLRNTTSDPDFVYDPTQETRSKRFAA